MSKDIRLQKYLADRGVASRRKCEDIIAAGRVTVNGDTVTVPGTRVDPSVDKITLDGNPVKAGRPQTRTIILYKPRGYICSASSEQGRTVYELIKGIEERLVPVGRLDKDSEGLLMMSNDGELVNRLTHPGYGQAKVYEVTVSGAVNDRILKKLNSRMLIDGYRIQPAEVSIKRKSNKEGRTVLKFILKEGRNRQIRKMCENVDLKIHRLIRTEAGGYKIMGLKVGEWREA